MRERTVMEDLTLDHWYYWNSEFCAPNELLKPRQPSRAEAEELQELACRFSARLARAWQGATSSSLAAGREASCGSSHVLVWARLSEGLWWWRRSI